jgi:hypothetical protein
VLGIAVNKNVNMTATQMTSATSAQIQLAARITLDARAQDDCRASPGLDEAAVRFELAVCDESHVSVRLARC